MDLIVWIRVHIDRATARSLASAGPGDDPDGVLAEYRAHGDRIELLPDTDVGTLSAEEILLHGDKDHAAISLVPRQHTDLARVSEIVGDPGACDSAQCSARDHVVVGVRPAGTAYAQPRLRESRPVLMDRPWTQGCRKAYRSWCVSVTKITPLPTAGAVSMVTWSVACHEGPHAVAPHPPAGNAERTPVLEVT